MPAEEFLAIEGLDEELVAALQENARKAIAKHEAELKDQGGEELMRIHGIDTELALALVAKGIKTLEDLAEQAIDDLLDLGIDAQRAGDIIMEARNLTWFKDEYEAQLKAQAEADAQAAAEQRAWEAAQAHEAMLASGHDAAEPAAKAAPAEPAAKAAPAEPAAEAAPAEPAAGEPAAAHDGADH